MQFRLLGPVDVLDGDRTLGITARRERATLLRLLLEPGRPIDADRLIDDVWGDAPPADARGSLRVLVARLRRRLEVAGEPRILTGAAGYELRLSVDDEVDAARFEALLGRAREERAAGAAGAAGDSLREALDLWRGLPLGDLAELDFARPEAVRLEESRLGAIEARIDADLACGRHAEVVGDLEGLTGTHPLREGLWAHRMVALYRSGRQAEALRAYQELREVLADEVGLAPTPALVQLEASILAGDLPPVTPLPAAGAPTRVAAGAPGRARADRAVDDGQRPFVGRARELASLQRSWAAAGAGERRVVLVHGEPGAGKTRLAEQVAARVERDGGLVLEGHFDEEMLLPYQGFVEAVQQLRAGPVGHVGAGPLDRLLHHDGPEPEPPLEGHGTGELERYRLFSAIEAALDAAAATTTTLLVLDDLHWADAPSLLLLKQIARSRTPAPLLVLATYRSTELGEDHPLHATLGQLHRARNVEEVEVGPLQVADLTELVELRLGLTAGEAAAIADAVAQRTDGHALFSEALVQAMSDPRLDAVSRQVIDVPTTVREFVAASVSRLSRPARSMLAVGATCGSSFRVATALRAAAVDADVGLDGVEECVRSRLLLDGDEPGVLRFSHNLVRDVVYENLPAVRRAHLHQALADTIEAEVGDGDGERSAEVVHHLGLAPTDPANLRRQVAHARATAAASMAKLAYESAADLLLHALDAHARVDGPPGERAELLVLAARPMVLTGRPTEASARCSEAIELATAAGEPEVVARAALVLEEATWTGYGFMRPAEAAALATVLRRAIAALDGRDSGDAPILRAELLARLPRVLHFGTSPAERLEPAEEATRQAEASGLPRLRGAALEGMRWALWGDDDVDRLGAVSEQVLPEARAAGDAALEVRGQVWRYLARLDRGDLAGVRAAVADLRSVGVLLPEPLALWYPEVADTALALLGGRVDAAEASALAALSVARRFDLGWAVETFGIQLHQIRREQGRLAEVEEATIGVAAAHHGEPAWQLAAADLHLQLGRPAEAAALLGEVVTAIPELPRDLTWLAVVALAADLCADLEDEAAAAVLYPALLPCAGRVVVVGPGVVCLGSASRPLGALAGLVGEWDRALGHLDDALAANQALEAAPWVARTHLARARVQARRGEAASASASLTAADGMATALAIPLLLSECARAGG